MKKPLLATQLSFGKTASYGDKANFGQTAIIDETAISKMAYNEKTNGKTATFNLLLG